MSTHDAADGLHQVSVHVVLHGDETSGEVASGQPIETVFGVIDEAVTCQALCSEATVAADKSRPGAFDGRGERCFAPDSIGIRLWL